MKHEPVETYHHAGCTIKVEHDPDPENPRKEWDNVGTMVCWHRRYTLGDEQPDAEPETYRNDLAAPFTEELSCRVDRIRDHFGYASHHAKKVAAAERALSDATEKALSEHFIILPLYLYDHSGITISTGSFSCPWDSGQVGFIYCTLEKALHEWGAPGSAGWDDPASFTLKDDGSIRTVCEAAICYLEGEVETYDDYLTGSVYGYAVEDDETGEDVDSCWGFFGYDETKADGYMVGEAKSAAERHRESQDALHRETEMAMCCP